MAEKGMTTSRENESEEASRDDVSCEGRQQGTKKYSGVHPAKLTGNGRRRPWLYVLQSQFNLVASRFPWSPHPVSPRFLCVLCFRAMNTASFGRCPELWSRSPVLGPELSGRLWPISHRVAVFSNLHRYQLCDTRWTMAYNDAVCVART
jgi:hypothetical protein